jgi:O-antigen ligase
MIWIRGFIVVSTIAAALVEAALANTYSPQVFLIALAGFVLMLIAGQRLRATTLPIIVAAIYLAPAIFLATLGYEGYGLDVIWILPLLGLIVSERAAWVSWSLPARWQWPLVTWAAMVAIAWPIVFLREADFALWILPLKRVSNTSIGTGPWEVGQNIAYFAVGHNLGILLIDAFCRWYTNQQARFRRDVLAAMSIAAGIASIVAVYQGFVDLSFLNTGFWTYMIRAPGTLADPNKLGSVAAFWTIGSVVLARRLPKPWPMTLAVVAIVLGVAAVWLSGSRTGLAALTVSVVLALIEAIRSWRAGHSQLDLRRVALAGAGLIAVALALVLVLQNASTHTVIARGVLGYVPFIGDRGIRQSVNELLWERNGYGPSAIEMIKEHPIDGVGVGTFHALSYDFGKLRGYFIVPDNAQNWFRHIFAEFGLLGSVPMLWWCVVLAMLMLSRPTGDRPSFGMLRGVLIGFGVASTFGMPAQSNAIVITFWVFVFWLWTEAHPTHDSAVEPIPSSRWPRNLLIAAAALLVIHVGMTTMDAFGDLRPRHRAERWDWYYRYGFYTNDNDGMDLEPDPGGNPIGRRWTMKDSLAVIKVKGKVLKFVAWIDHPDSDVNPVHTRIWADSQLVYEGELKRSPIFLDIPATPGKTHMRIETAIDRTWRPSDSGSRDSRELGLSIRDWVWQ